MNEVVYFKNEIILDLYSEQYKNMMNTVRNSSFNKPIGCSFHNDSLTLGFFLGYSIDMTIGKATFKFKQEKG